MLRKLKRDDMIFILVMLLFTVGYCPFAEKFLLYDYSYNDCISLPAEEGLDIAKDLKEVEVVAADGENVYIQFDFTSDEYELRGLPCDAVTGFDKFMQFVVVCVLYFGVSILLCLAILFVSC